MKVVSSAKISEKHQQHLRIRFPEVKFTFCENVGQAVEAASDADVLITYGEDLNVDWVERFPKLKWIQVISAGVEKLPLSHLHDKGILVTNAKGIHKIPMAEFTLGIMLQHVRRSFVFYDQQKKSEWDRSPRIDELAGKTVGIIGAGAIGGEIARKAKAFDVKVLGYNRSGEHPEHFDQIYTGEQLKEILSLSDFVVVILPLTPSTKKLIGAEELRAMKNDAVLINIARGLVIDENALITALQEKWFAGAYLDVFSEEPLPKDHPFWKLDNCWITPHVSGRSPHYMTRALDIFMHNISKYLEGRIGEMLNQIDCIKGY